MQASLLTAPGGSYFSSPLSVALSSYMDEPQCRAALLDALMSLAASPDISAPGAACSARPAARNSPGCALNLRRLQETKCIVSLHQSACALLLWAFISTSHKGAQIHALTIPCW